MFLLLVASFIVLACRGPVFCQQSNFTTETNKWEITSAELNGNDYFLFKSDDEKKYDFFEAEENCQRFAGHLSFFDSAEEFELIRTLFGSNSQQPAWIGLFHRGECLHYLPNFRLYFTDRVSLYNESLFSSSPAQHFKFWGKSEGLQQWRVGDEPNHQQSFGGGASEYCVALDTSVGNGMEARLNDLVCHRKLSAHICKQTSPSASVSLLSPLTNGTDFSEFEYAEPVKAVVQFNRKVVKQLDSNLKRTGAKCTNSFIADLFTTTTSTTTTTTTTTTPKPTTTTTTTAKPTTTECSKRWSYSQQRYVCL